MKRTEVHKFGGTSVGDADRVASVADLIGGVAAKARVVLVTSAMAGVTDSLVKAADVAAQGQRATSLEILDSLARRHRETLRAVAPDADESVGNSLDEIEHGLSDVLRAVARLRQLSPRTRDLVLSAGEKLSVRLIAAALRQRGFPGLAVDADLFLETNDAFGEATPLSGVADRCISSFLSPLLEEGEIPVVTGFVGRASDGATTTLGRGGSDYSATIIAAALSADEITIWTDVDGVHTANPAIVPDARLIRQLNFREAAELAFYGAKILHQRTILPVASRGIPVRIRNSFDPTIEGSRIDVRYTPGSHPVKAISAVRGQALISVEGKGMAGIPGIAARLFGALADKRISVTMISQSSAESSICFAVPDDAAEAAELALKRAFRGYLSAGDVDEIVVQRRVGLVAAVGLGMAHTTGVSGRLFSSLGKRRVNVLAIAQGASELNISLAVDQRQVDDAVRAIHQGFGLHRVDTGEDTTGRLDLLLFGCGSIGRALCELVLERRSHMFDRFGLEPRIVALCDRSGYLFRPNGIARAEVLEALRAKEAGKRVTSLPGSIECGDPREMLKKALSFRLARPILVDVSDSSEGADVMLEAFRLGCDAVTANKLPLAGPFESYRQLRSEAMSLGRVLKAEATVGAGLPVIDTLETMLGAGDRLTAAQGSLSGTLAFVLSGIEQGAPFSSVVEDAVRRGYTEPNPMIDLCGEDVARKAVILSRMSGLIDADLPVSLTGLVDRSWVDLEVSASMARLKELDGPMAERVNEARSHGKVLRFVASVSPGRIEVGPMTVDADSALGMLRGTDNMIVFQSERYDSRPLVISGPGAGIDVTAMGVMGDILRIAAERR